MTRDEMRAFAIRVVRLANPPEGVQVVVAVTDAAGEWMGVHSTVDYDRTLAILACGAQGAADDIIDAEAHHLEVMP